MVVGMNSAPFYVPTLRGKAGELDALARLSPFAKRFTNPIIDIPKPPDIDSSGTRRLISEKVVAIQQSWGTANIVYIDLSRHSGDVHGDVSSHPATIAFHIARQCRLNAVPVSGTILTRGPSTDYIDAVAKIASIDKRGAALKLYYSDLTQGEGVEKLVLRTIEQLRLEPEYCDLILDLEAFDRYPLDLLRENKLLKVIRDALSALDRVNLRSTTVCGSSIPERVGKKHNEKPLRVLRRELQIWRNLQRRQRDRQLGFGDYGVVYAFQSDAGAPVQPPCRIRISTGDEHVLYRSPPSTYRSLRARVARDGELRELPDCWGRRGIVGKGKGFTGTGGPPIWVAWDTNLHLETTVRAIHLAVGAYGLRSETSKHMSQSPWLQNELTIED